MWHCIRNTKVWKTNSTLYKKYARQSALEETVRKIGLENLTTEDAKQKKSKSDLSAGVIKLKHL
jgi:hypothetical protein